MDGTEWDGGTQRSPEPQHFKAFWKGGLLPGPGVPTTSGPCPQVPALRGQQNQTSQRSTSAARALKTEGLNLAKAGRAQPRNVLCSSFIKII